MLKIGIVGCGAIGSYIAGEIDKNPNRMKVLACWDSDADKIKTLAGNMRVSPCVLEPGEMIKQVDLIVEAACAQAVAELLPLIVENNKKLLVISVGGLVGQEEMLSKISAGMGELFIPSGALAGLDAIKSIPKEEIRKCRITTTKPPRGIKGAPFFKGNPVDLENLKKTTLIFEGTAKEAVSLFPKNINVAAALSLAGIGLEKTEVRILVDPASSKNSHEICIEGTFGKIVTRTENLPSPTNPKTSFLAALSVVASIRAMTSSIHIGT